MPGGNSFTQFGHLICLGATDQITLKAGSVAPGSRPLDGSLQFEGLLSDMTTVRLFTDATPPTPVKGSPPIYGLTEASGGGYVTKAITPVQWLVLIPAGGQTTAVLDDQTWTFTGAFPTTGNLLGAYITDSSNFDEPLIYWSRSTAISLVANDKAVADSLEIFVI